MLLRLKRYHLFALSLFITTLWDPPAQAAMGIHFDLAISTPVISSTDSTETTHYNPPSISSVAASAAHRSSLPIPVRASQPPIGITTSHGSSPDNIITSAPNITPLPSEALPTTRVLTPQNQTTHVTLKSPIGLSFSHIQSTKPAPTSPSVTSRHQPAFPQWIYKGGSNSLVARVIGSAEGTRTANGQPTHAYYGHTDPGNGAWNMGTFSYQHDAKSPDDADRKQLQRLQRQGKTIERQANSANLTMTLGEILNGLDLANQSPRAALEQGGYVDRLVQARQQGMQNSDAIIWARTYSYLEPNTQDWNAPGLGNTLSSIKRDQNRRHQAVARAFEQYQVQHNINIDLLTETLPSPIPVAKQQPSEQSPVTQKSAELSMTIAIQSPPVQPVGFSDETQAQGRITYGIDNIKKNKLE